MRHAVLAAVLALAAAPVHASDGKVPPDIQKLVDTWLVAFNAHDAKKTAAVFAEDATFVNPRGQSATGRAEIERRFAEDFQGPLQGASATARISHVRMLGKDHSYVDVEQEVSGPNLPSDAPSPRRAHVALVLHKKGKAWEVLEARPHFWLRPPGAAGAPSAAPAGGGTSDGTAK